MTAVNIIYSKALTAMKYDIGLVYRSATWIENVQGLNFNANSEVGILRRYMLGVISSRQQLKVNLDTYDRVHGKEREACEATMRRIIDDYEKEAETHRPIIKNVLQSIGDMKCAMLEAGIEVQPLAAVSRSRRMADSEEK